MIIISNSLGRGNSMENNELEYKFLISKEQYKDIIITLKDADFIFKPILQVNYFYDTFNYDYLKQGITIRIRQIEENLRLEVKSKGYMVNESLFYRKEQCIEINKLPKRINLKDYFKNPPHPTLSAYLSGNLVTERLNYSVSKDVSVHLDKNIYLGVIDYELEIECNNKSDIYTSPIISDLVHNFRKSYYKKTRGKKTRFFNHKISLFP